jgi:hypothetical protein
MPGTFNSRLTSNSERPYRRLVRSASDARDSRYSGVQESVVRISQ